jgi:hypothetical protein
MLTKQFIRVGGKIWGRQKLVGGNVVKISTGIGNGNFIVGSNVMPILKQAQSHWETLEDQVYQVEQNLDPFGGFGAGDFPETRPGPEELGFHIGDRVQVIEALDSVRIPRGTETPVGEGVITPSQGGETLQVGLNEVGEVVGLNVDSQGAPLQGSMLIKLPSGRLVVVFPDEVQKV